MSYNDDAIDDYMEAVEIALQKVPALRGLGESQADGPVVRLLCPKGHEVARVQMMFDYDGVPRLVFVDAHGQLEDEKDGQPLADRWKAARNASPGGRQTTRTVGTDGRPSTRGWLADARTRMAFECPGKGCSKYRGVTTEVGLFRRYVAALAGNLTGIHLQ